MQCSAFLSESVFPSRATTELREECRRPFPIRHIEIQHAALSLLMSWWGLLAKAVQVFIELCGIMKGE